MTTAWLFLTGMTRSFWLFLLLGVLLLGDVLNWRAEQVYIALLFVAVVWLGAEVFQLGGGFHHKHRKLIKQIEEGKLVEPKHRPPAKFGGKDEWRHFFEDFASFADVVNGHLLFGGGWRIQEDSFQAAGIVRHYDILCNGAKVGYISLGCSCLEYTTSEFEVTVSVGIHNALVFDYHELRCFLQTIPPLVCGNADELQRAMTHIDERLTSSLWNSVRTPNALESLSVRFKGTCAGYFLDAKLLLSDATRRRWNESTQRWIDANRQPAPETYITSTSAG